MREPVLFVVPALHEVLPQRAPVHQPLELLQRGIIAIRRPAGHFNETDAKKASLETSH